ncbi:MAG: Sec-independent protein translocase protein TatB [Nevskia sp.]|nr:Sec-independent protein translocase protein TatB [Nevskia sp.]
MFDFSFSELLLCFVVALVVLGPERMPAVARAVGRWTGKARVYMRNLTAELERETQVAELKKQIDDAQRILREQSQAIHTETHKLVEEAKPSVTAASKPPTGNG